MTVGEAGLAAAVAEAMKREFPCHSVEEVSGEAGRELFTVEYYWTDCGELELRDFAAFEYHGEERYHCLRLIDVADVMLATRDGDAYAMYIGCTYKSCAT